MKLHLARTYAYDANGAEGVAIVDITGPEQPALYRMFNADGAIVDARDIVVASTNASPFLYVAEGAGGLEVVQLTAPENGSRPAHDVDLPSKCEKPGIPHTA